MADYYMLGNRIWVEGWSEEPELYYYADSSKTLTITLYDADGNLVKDNSGNTVQLTYNAQQGINTISLGDWLSAVNITWGEGTYILDIYNGSTHFYAPLLIVSTGMSIPVTETDKIEKIIVIDTISNVTVELPPTANTIPASSRFRTLIYQHNNDTKMGRLVSYVGMNQEFDTKWVRNAIINMSIKFNSIEDMASWLAKYGYVRSPDSDTAKAIGSLLNSDPDKVVSILGLYGILTGINGRILDYNIDTDNLTVNIKMLVRLGFGWSDIANALRWALGVGAIVGGIAVGVAVTVGTFGLGTAIGIGLAAAGITFGLKILYGASSDTSTGTGSSITDLKNNIQNVANQGKNNITNLHNKAVNDVNTLYQNGEITEHARDVILQDIDNIYKTAITVIDEVVEESKKAIDQAYSRGYNDGKKAMYPWIAVSGLGGAGIGYFIGSKK